MLGGNDAAQVALAEAISPPVRRFDRLPVVLLGCIQARHADEARCYLGGDGEPATPGGGLQAAGVGVHVKGVGRQGNGVAATAGGTQAQAHRLRHLDGGTV